MFSDSITIQYKKIEKMTLKMKNDLIGKFKKMNIKDLNWKKPFESLLPAKEEKKEEIKESKQGQSLFEFPENEENEEDLEKRKKREVIFEMVLFLVLGILLGITIKTEAVKRITIGFNDYKIINGQNAYNVSDMQNKLEQQAEVVQSQATQQQVQQNSAQPQQ